MIQRKLITLFKKNPGKYQQLKEMNSTPRESYENQNRQFEEIKKKSLKEIQGGGPDPVPKDPSEG